MNRGARRTGVRVALVAAVLLVAPVVSSLASFMAEVANAGTWDSGRWTPAAPEDLRVTAVAEEGLSLSWRSVTTPVAAADYQVSYRPVGGTFQERPFAGGTTATVSGLAPDAAYELRIRARSGPQGPDGSRHTSAWSPLVAASTDVPPDVAVTAPEVDAFVRGVTTLTARATDAGGVDRVAFLVDGEVVGRATSAPFAVTLDTTALADGPIAVTARATDRAGSSTTSDPVRVVVDNTAPTVSVRVAPDDPARLVGTVQLLADAADATSGVAAVDFRADAACARDLGTATGAPFTRTWDTSACPDGPVTVTATARDLAGNTSSSTSRTYQIDNAAAQVALTAPAAGATVTGTTTLRATATDAGSSVSRVEFQVDGTTVGTATSTPFEVAWMSTTVTDGSRQVTATAISASGRQAVSSPRSVTVRNAPDAPTGLAAAGGQNRQVPLSWNAPARASTYRVEHRVAGSSGAFTTVTTTTTSATVTGLTNGTTYEFRVVALDARGQSSPPSATVTATPRRGTGPPVPAGLSAAGAGQQLTATWTAVSDAELAGYRLRYRVAGTSGAFTELDVSGTSRVVTGLAPGTSYQVAVAARDLSGNQSAWSSSVTALTIPATPQNLTAVRQQQPRQVQTAWSASAGAVDYELQHRAVGATTWTGAGTTTTSSLVTDLLPQGSYEFRVRSGNASGSSAFSTVVAIGPGSS